MEVTEQGTAQVTRTIGKSGIACHSSSGPCGVAPGAGPGPEERGHIVAQTPIMVFLEGRGKAGRASLSRFQVASLSDLSGLCATG